MGTLHNIPVILTSYFFGEQPDGLSHHATGLVAALIDIEDDIAPHDPADHAPPQREGQDDGGDCSVGKGDDIN